MTTRVEHMERGMAATHKTMIEVYEAVLEGTDHLHGTHIGPDLAYVLGAMLKGQMASFRRRCRIVQVLQERLPPDHLVWRFLEIT